MNNASERYEQEIISYFKHKAEKYDLVDNQIYWVFSDTLLWYLLKERILNTLPKDFHFLDAGGGTGRWTLKILEACPEATGTIFDLSEDMTKEALKKAKSMGLLDRLTVVNGNLNNVDRLLADQKFDLIYNFHNVLGFVENPTHIIKNLTGLLSHKGLLISMVPSQYHNIFFNLATNSINDAESAAQNGVGRFTNNMPAMNLFTPDSIKTLYATNKLDINFITGFPNFIFPGFQETQLEGSTQRLNDILNANFDSILEMEKKHLYANDIAARGNNIFIVGQKVR